MRACTAQEQWPTAALLQGTGTRDFEADSCLGGAAVRCRYRTAPSPNGGDNLVPKALVCRFPDPPIASAQLLNDRRTGAGCPEHHGCFQAHLRATTLPDERRANEI
jgi:hypothetical protein